MFCQNFVCFQVIYNGIFDGMRPRLNSCYVLFLLWVIKLFIVNILSVAMCFVIMIFDKFSETPIALI